MRHKREQGEFTALIVVGAGVAPSDTLLARRAAAQASSDRHAVSEMHEGISRKEAMP